MIQLPAEQCSWESRSSGYSPFPAPNAGHTRNTGKPESPLRTDPADYGAARLPGALLWLAGITGLCRPTAPRHRYLWTY